MKKYKDDPNSNLHEQIELAFKRGSDIAGVLHGIRKIHQGSVGKRTSLFPSKKNAGMIPIESNLELAYAIELERDLSVVSYRTQALKIQLSQSESNYPDFLVKYSDGRVEVHEVKPDKHNLTEKKAKKHQRIKKIINYHNIQYKVVDKNDVVLGFNQTALLYFYQRLGIQSWTDQLIDKAIKVIPTHGKLLFTEIQKILENNSLPVDMAYYLIFYKYIPMPVYIPALVEAVRSRGLL